MLPGDNSTSASSSDEELWLFLPDSFKEEVILRSSLGRENKSTVGSNVEPIVDVSSVETTAPTDELVSVKEVVEVSESEDGLSNPKLDAE